MHVIVVMHTPSTPYPRFLHPGLQLHHMMAAPLLSIKTPHHTSACAHSQPHRCTQDHFRWAAGSSCRGHSMRFPTAAPLECPQGYHPTTCEMAKRRKVVECGRQKRQAGLKRHEVSACMLCRFFGTIPVLTGACASAGCDIRKRGMQHSRHHQSEGGFNAHPHADALRSLNGSLACPKEFTHRGGMHPISFVHPCRACAPPYLLSVRIGEALVRLNVSGRLCLDCMQLFQYRHRLASVSCVMDGAVRPCRCRSSPGAFFKLEQFDRSATHPPYPTVHEHT